MAGRGYGHEPTLDRVVRQDRHATTEDAGPLTELLRAMHDQEPIWCPSAQRIEASAMQRFAREAEVCTGRALNDYEALWQWSIDEPEHFWSSIWNFCGVVGRRGDRVVQDREKMPGARWF